MTKNVAKPKEQLLYVYIKNGKTTSKNFHVKETGLKVGNYVISKDNERTIIEPTETNEAKVIKYKKNSYVQQKQEDGSIVLVPVQKQVAFELTEKEGRLRTMRMNVAVRNFIDEYEVAGIYGLFATGERLTLEKMR